ncbi:MAG: hypothetical protein ACI97A_002016 [Planctomycetota bacterium]|jgi:hypothetical protein
MVGRGELAKRFGDEPRASCFYGAAEGEGGASPGSTIWAVTGLQRAFRAASGWVLELFVLALIPLWSLTLSHVHQLKLGKHERLQGWT